jgi:FkbM family methyltransferase
VTKRFDRGPLTRGSDRALAVAQRVRTTAARSLAATPAAVAALERAGVHTLADRLDRRRGGGDIMALRVPADMHDLRTRRIKAWRRQGRDQCVEAFYRGGWWGYERPQPDVVLATLRREPGVFLDVGANTGMYSLIASTVPGVVVHAFEAYPPVAALLRENLALNPGARHVRVVDAAVSDVSGTLDLFVPPESGPIETSSSTEADFKEGSVPITVAATTLDAYWQSVGSPPVSAVKLDVEGAEHRVLAGAERMVSTVRPVIFLEVLPDAHLAALEAFATAHGLVDVRMGPDEAVVNDRIRFDERAWNHALVPVERLATFLEPLPRLEIRVTRLDEAPAAAGGAGGPDAVAGAAE